MHLTIVGSGTVVPDAERACACAYVESPGVRLLLDCGPGAVHHLARFGVPWASLTHVALTHFHTDHVGDLPFLFFALKHGLAAPRREPLALLGPAGTMERLRALADALGTFVLHPGIRLAVQEMGEGHRVALGEGVGLTAYRTPHCSASLAYRVDAPDASLGYTGDTGPDDGLARFFAGVDTLLAECSLPDAAAVEGHLTPSRVAALARVARPRRLLLTHVYPQLDRAALPALVHDAGWEGDVLLAADGLTLDV